MGDTKDASLGGRGQSATAVHVGVGIAVARLFGYVVGRCEACGRHLTVAPAVWRGSLAGMATWFCYFGGFIN